MKTISTFWKTDDAHLLRLRLESAGFPSILQDENITQLHPWRAAAIGGVRLQVDDSNFEAVQKFLAESNDLPKSENPISDPDAFECWACRAIIPTGRNRCPACGWSYEDAPERD